MAQININSVFIFAPVFLFWSNPASLIHTYIKCATVFLEIAHYKIVINVIN